MYARDVMASLRRRWPWVAVALVITIVAVLFTVRSVAPTYEMKASIVLVPPRSTDDPQANRFLTLGGLEQAAAVFTRAMTSDQTHKAAARVAPDGEFTVEPDYTTSAPIVVFSATATDEQEAKRLLDVLLGQVPLTLNRLQAGLDIQKTSRIVAAQLTQDSQPTIHNKAPLRAGVAVGAGLLAFTIFGIGALDGLLERRRRREEASAAPVTVSEVPRSRAPGQTTSRHATEKDAPRPSNGSASGRSRRRALVQNPDDDHT